MYTEDQAVEEIREAEEEEIEIEDTTPEEPGAEEEEEEGTGPEEEEDPGQVDEPPAGVEMADIKKDLGKMNARIGYLMRKGAVPEEAPTPPAQEAEAEKPQEGDFATYDEYIDALTDFKVDQRLKTYEQEHTGNEEQGRLEQEEADFQQRMEVGKERYKDFDDIVRDPTVPITGVIVSAFRDSDIAADIAYYLATHRKETAAMSRMTPTRIGREIGKIETKLEAEFGDKPPAVPPKKTKAPAPIKPTGGNRASGISKDPNNMTHEEYRAWRKGQ